MAKHKGREVLTTGQVAKICNVAPRTVSKWFDSGQLRGYRIPGSKDRRIPVDQLIRFMRANGIPLTALDHGATRVLLVDEDAELTKLLGEALSHNGDCEITTASSAFEAGMLAQSSRPQVIVLDVSLGDVHPKRIVETIRASENLSGVKLIATSGAMTEGQGQRLLQEGFAGYLRKPFDIEALRDLIDQVIHT
jgi:excisionase family DNA binding protein